MDLIVIPFHDWRKSEKEGFRTRDVHFIKALAQNSHINKILVVNRPSTWLELAYKKSSKTLQGKQILKSKSFILTEVAHNIYVVDYHAMDIFGQILKKHEWFMEKYKEQRYFEFILRCSDELALKDPYLLLQNIFAAELAVKIRAKRKIFDAWDNFLRFPAYQSLKSRLYTNYDLLSDKIPNWITNSQENIDLYRDNFKVKHITLIKNGVKADFVSTPYELPEDLIGIKRPIIGFGGKISYLIDYGLVNYITLDNPEASFVFVGQILDKRVFDKIEKRNNVFFLGDKKYGLYPNYVRSFDICIVPYNINEGQHGGDSMKAYEYLLAGKKVVGTNGNGLEDLIDHVYVTKTKKDFSNALKNLENHKEPLEVGLHSWESKAQKILSIFGA